MQGQQELEDNEAISPERISFNLTLIHLDLKGAPPKVSYLSEVLPLFSRLGANGLLIEYEDTFPYYGELLPLRAEHAYSPQDIREILRLAQLHHLEVIPLIQTFGHMEFVLKHNEFSHLREIPLCSGSLNPHKEESLRLLQLMIGQVMDLHPAVRWLHIGSDEVHYLGDGEESKTKISESGLCVEDLFLSHVKKVARHVTVSYPSVRVIAWDDMLREASVQTLAESGVPQLVEPMIWDYNSNLDLDGRTELINKYLQCGFRKMWLASAFKGATGPFQQLPFIKHHLENQKCWLQVAQRVSEGILQGLALTGWQRYDHFSVLCELLPVGIPSLAVCLQTLKEGSFSEKTTATVREILGMESLDIENYVSETTGCFPGSEVLKLMTKFIYLKTSTKEYLEGDWFLNGWFSQYQRRRKHLHYMMVQQIKPQAVSLLSKWSSVLEELRAAMVNIFPPITVEEWIEVNTVPHYLQLQKLVEDLNSATEEGCSLAQ